MAAAWFQRPQAKDHTLFGALSQGNSEAFDADVWRLSLPLLSASPANVFQNILNVSPEHVSLRNQFASAQPHKVERAAATEALVIVSTLEAVSETPKILSIDSDRVVAFTWEQRSQGVDYKTFTLPFATEVTSATFQNIRDLHLLLPPDRIVLSLKELVEALLLACTGVSSSLFEVDSQQRLHPTKSFCVENVSDSALGSVVNEICLLGSQLLALEKFAQQANAASRPISSTILALSRLASDYIIFYHHQIHELQERVHKQDTFLTPLGIDLHLSTLQGQVRVLTKLCQNDIEATAVLDQTLTLVEAMADHEQLLVLLHAALSTITEPYLRFWSSWLSDGRCIDPHDEFCIRVDEILAVSTDDERYWTEAFQLQTSQQRQPPIIFRQIAELALICGKELSVLRRLNAFLPPPFELNPWSLLSSNEPVHISLAYSIRSIIFSQVKERCDVVHRHLLDYLWSQLYLKDYINVPLRFLLWADGLVVSALHDCLLRFAKSSHSWTPAELAGRLTDAMKPLRSNIDYKLLLVARSLKDAIVSAPIRTRRYLDVLAKVEVQLSMPWPINQLFPKNIVQQYSKIFSFLLRFKFVGVIARLGLQDRKTHRSSRLFAFHAQHVLYAIEDYLCGFAVTATWQEMITSMLNAASFDEIMKIHVETVKKIKHRCFLGKRMAPIIAIIEGMLRDVVSWFELEQNATDQQEEIQHKFLEKSRLFFKVLDHVASRGNLDLQVLLTRLNYNAYYADLPDPDNLDTILRSV